MYKLEKMKPRTKALSFPQTLFVRRKTLFAAGNVTTRDTNFAKSQRTILSISGAGHR